MGYIYYLQYVGTTVSGRFQTVEEIFITPYSRLVAISSALVYITEIRVFPIRPVFGLDLQAQRHFIGVRRTVRMLSSFVFKKTQNPAAR